jgi:hypothetical protein
MFNNWLTCQMISFGSRKIDNEMSMTATFWMMQLSHILNVLSVAGFPVLPLKIFSFFQIVKHHSCVHLFSRGVFVRS